MHIIQEKIGKPTLVQVSWDEKSASFAISPLPSWYWMTLWNSLRRVLLSSLPWVAITWIKVKWASHEYASINWVKDSLLDIILNLKWVYFKKFSKDREIVKITKKWAWELVAWDIQTSSDIEVLNPDYVITELTSKDAEFQAEIVIEKWVWYLPAKQRQVDEDLAEFIFIDATFTPVKSVQYNIEPTRVGDMINLDKLVINLETDWSMNTLDALKFSTNILTSYFELITEDSDPVEPDFVSDFSRTWMIEEDESEKETYTPIEILNLSPRTLNALLNAEIWSVEQLLKCSRAKLWTFRWFWKKAMDEVSDSLEERWLKLLGD